MRAKKAQYFLACCTIYRYSIYTGFVSQDRSRFCGEVMAVGLSILSFASWSCEQISIFQCTLVERGKS
ncbi:unnamed protein product [Coffea canephora]|uniref:Uncharacterized protein n=1 Tax=Coffea canephora TaxID=49390 RepID=A0A068U9K7_COFCA|nr:unnamed protein product [Coffea canephora]